MKTRTLASFRWLAPLATLLLLGAGCFGPSTPAAGPDGGVFRSRDSGVTWSQLKVLNLGGKLGSIADLGTVTMAIDPEDQNAIYVGTILNGLLYSLDGGDSWTQAKGLASGQINAIAVNPKDKCSVYAARANQIYLTTDCSRDWNQVYFDPRTDKSFTALAVDWFNPQIVYIGTNDGDILRSDDGAATWKAINRVDGIRITRIAIDPHDSRIIYVSTDGAGIQKSTDGGQTWDMIKQQFDAFDTARRVHMVVLDPSTPNVVYNVSKYGLLRSSDGGATWNALKLPTPPTSVDLKDMVVNPLNPQELVYATDSSIVFSLDGGATWSPKKLPTARGVAALLFDRATPQGLFIAATPPKKQ